MNINYNDNEQLSRKKDMFKFKIDGKMYEVATPCIIGHELLELAGKSCNTHELRMKTAGNTMVKIECDENVDLRHPGLEKFVTLPLEQQEGEAVETFNGHGPKIKIKIDGKMYEVNCASMTGKELLELAGKRPYTKYGISKRVKGNRLVPVGYDEEVDLSESGLEKFITLPYEQTEGINWTAKKVGSNWWYGVCYGNEKFVVVGTDGDVAYSTDGISWTTTTISDTPTIMAVCCGNGKFVAVGRIWNASGYYIRAIYYSTDGINWTSKTMGRGELYGICPVQ